MRPCSIRSTRGLLAAPGLCTVPVAQSRRSRSNLRPARLIVCAWGRKGSHQTKQSVPPVKVTAPPSGQPWIVKAGLAVVAVAAILQLFRNIRGRGSMNSLESRGLITEGEQSTESNDPFYNRMMRNVNTVHYEELSQEQIEAARMRRSQDRRNNERVDLDKIQLPANHPFAVSKELSEEEEQLQMARLNVRRGMPLRDINEVKNRQGARPPP